MRAALICIAKNSEIITMKIAGTSNPTPWWPVIWISIIVTAAAGPNSSKYQFPPGSWNNGSRSASSACVMSSSLRPSQKPSRRVGGPVGEHDVGSGAPDTGQRFQCRGTLVDPVVGGRGANHRVLPRDLIRGHRHRRDFGGRRHHIEVPHRGFDHHDVGPLLDIQLDLA